MQRENVTAATPTGVRWLVINTQPHKEQLALENLARQGYEAYCPFIVRRIRHARRVSNARRPMFPSYLFVRHAGDEMRWRPILSTLGVRCLVQQGDRPGLLDGAFVAALKTREVDGAVQGPARQLSIGQSVEMAGGPFDGLVGEIVELRDNDRIAILLGLMNTRIKTIVNTSGVRETACS